VRLFLKQLWSTYFFYTLYAHASAAELGAARMSEEATDELDRWALSRTAGTAELVAERLDAYDATTAGRAIAELVEDISNWYVRRSRRRFWDGDPAAFATLRVCLVTISKLLAPFCPFIADEIYDNLDGTMQSVHLCDFPEVGYRAVGARLERDEELERAMALARETVRLGLGARGKAKIKVRQPLGEAVVVAAGREREAIERLSDVIREELNIKRVRFVAAADQLGSYEAKANYRKLGPVFGKSMPLAADAIAALDPARLAAAFREDGSGSGESIGITVDGREHTLSADEVILTMRAPEGYSVEREGAHAVALDLAVDEQLREEGFAREIVHAVQTARKSAGLEVEDRIELALDGDAALLGAARTHRDYLARETLAVELDFADAASAPAAEPGYSGDLEIDGLKLTISLRKA
jgi:isoleucyl-tRNA synthetase